MQTVFGKTVLALTICASLASCASREERLLNADNGPDEFGVLPGKPLQTPTNYSTLPSPTPDGSNLADATPYADGISALGGR